VNRVAAGVVGCTVTVFLFCVFAVVVVLGAASQPPPVPKAVIAHSLIPGDLGDTATLAARMGVPERALRGVLMIEPMTQAATGCLVPWWLLLGITYIESGAGTFNDAQIDDDWVVRPLVFGPPTPYGRAMGPFQFIPDSWDIYGLDGSGDGVADPHNFLDGVLAAANHLCGSSGGAGGDLSDEATARRGIFGYNHSDEYVNDVWSAAVGYRVAATTAAGDGDTGMAPGVEPAGPVGTLVAVPNCVADDCELDASWAPYLLAVLNLCRSQGFDIVIYSANRSYQEQSILYARYLSGEGGLAAAPGTSNHEGGQAVDLVWAYSERGIGPGDGAWECMSDNGAQYGVYQNPGITGRDSVHFSATGN
jgi:hypothetical protein